MHIELTEMLRCPEPHGENVLVLSTGEMAGRMVRSGIVGCPVCRKEYPIVQGVVDFTGRGTGVPAPAAPRAPAVAGPPVPRPKVEPQDLLALLDLSGPGGYVVLVGDATRHAEGLAALMNGIHFVGINPPPDAEELPVLSLLRSAQTIPLRESMARGVVVGADLADAPWLDEARRVLLRGRRLVVEDETASPGQGVTRLAAENGLWVGEKK